LEILNKQVQFENQTNQTHSTIISREVFKVLTNNSTTIHQSTDENEIQQEVKKNYFEKLQRY